MSYLIENQKRKGLELKKLALAQKFRKKKKISFTLKQGLIFFGPGEYPVYGLDFSEEI
jgi:hypothetical protein